MVDIIREENNNYTGRCVTLACKDGECGKVGITKPNDNKCFTYTCVEVSTGVWEWKSQPTAVNKECVSDACFRRECVAESGCVSTDICEGNTTECSVFTCKDEGGVKRCEEQNQLHNYTCKKEVCINGKKQINYFDLQQACPHENKCMVASCSPSGACEWAKKAPPDDDPCKVYTCNTTTGNYTWVPKCDDGLHCTENQCTIDGDCRYIPINCYDHINMTGYPCFIAECKEGNSTFKCVRKIKFGVFIDVCGNCIKQTHVDDTSSDSSLDFVSCTDAPSEPLIKESLAAAAIALIVVGALLAGAAVAVSGVVGTKTLLDRAHQASGQSTVSNPMYESNHCEMTNPTFGEEAD